MRAKVDRQSLEKIKEQVMADLAAVRNELGETEAMASIEQFINVALRVFAETNFSKLRAAMVAVEIQYRMCPSNKTDADA